MVVFVDYDEEDSFDEHHPPDHFAQPGVKADHNTTAATTTTTTDDYTDTDTPERSNPNRNSLFSTALSCYPIVKEIGRSVDLNTLHALSRTCRQFRANLLPFRQLLVRQTLCCENEYIETLSDMLSRGAAIPDSVKSVLRSVSQQRQQSGRLTSAKVRKCARDMVGECRRCSRVVCRNCTVKPPSNSNLKYRVRRLCATCRAAPLSYHFTLARRPESDHDPPTKTPSSSAIDDRVTNTNSFTAPAFLRTPCTCEDAVWLCYQCGQTLRNMDTTYRRVWAWRTRYSTSLDTGMGTGIGEGCEGVKCGRGEHCLAAEETELEVDAGCEVDDWTTYAIHQSHQSGSSSSSSSLGSHLYQQHHHYNNTIDSHHNGNDNDIQGAGAGEPVLASNRDEEEPGYFRQEMVGLGGVVKHKAKKRVVVGACVTEREDERGTGRYLAPEEDGEVRSWCAWCWRVIPGKREL